MTTTKTLIPVSELEAAAVEAYQAFVEQEALQTAKYEALQRAEDIERFQRRLVEFGLDVRVDDTELSVSETLTLYYRPGNSSGIGIRILCPVCGERMTDSVADLSQLGAILSGANRPYHRCKTQSEEDCVRDVTPPSFGERLEALLREIAYDVAHEVQEGN